MAKFRKKPVVVEVFRFHNHAWYGPDRELAEQFGIQMDNRGRWFIETLEGAMTVRTGDYVIRGIKGEHYPCKPDIFEATYEPAGDEHD